MYFSPRGLSLLKTFESFRGRAYPDAGGIPTIGYGTTLGVKLGDTCSEAQAGAWLARDVTSVVVALNRLVTVPVTQDQFDALVSLGYNVGVGAMGLAGSTLLRKLNAGDPHGAAREFPRWDLARGVPCDGLLRRREREQALFLSQQGD